MSENLLEALMRLFALLTDVKRESKSGRARVLVEDYLSRFYNREYINQYLIRFDYYLDTYHKAEPSEDAELEKQLEQNYSRVLEICSQFNKEMEEEPRLILVMSLLNFLNKEEVVRDEERQFVDTVARELRINDEDYQNLVTFILHSPHAVEDKDCLLYISGKTEPPYPNLKFICNPKQQVEVWVFHAKSTNSYFFRYAGVRNLYMNGNKAEQNRAYALNAGTVIKTSLMPPVYYSTIAEKFIQREDKGRIIYRALDVEYKFSNNQTGIHKFSFTGRSGQLIGVMGGSGSGKSTLLNVLNGNSRLSNGIITVNGYDLHAEPEELQGVIGYVPQDDMLIEELTVFENLYYNARLCFSHLSHNEIVHLVEKALNDFDLVEARKLVVGSPLKKILSGGQRKRLNIALELIREPSILFVDEPTSGLSSMDSEKVMVLLKRQTLKGKLVIINIHQPSSDLYKLIDKLLIIDKGGHIIYNGNPMDAIVYFKQMAHYVNPEERECYVCGNVKTEQPLRIIEARMVSPSGKPIRKRKVKPEEWYQVYLANFESKFEWKTKRQIFKKEKLPANLYNIPGRVKQFNIFAMRDAMAKFKDKQYLLINLLEAPILALILGFFTKFISGLPDNPDAYVFSENVNLPAYLFMSVVVSLFLGLNGSAEEIIKDRKLLKREKFLNLSRFSYLSSKMVILFALSAIQSLSFVLIGNSFLEVEGLNLSYWLILFSTSCFANMLGLNISSGLNSVVSIYILIPLILVPQLLFSGVIVSFDKLHKSITSQEYVPRIGDFMISRWSYEALAVNQFANNRYEQLVFADERLMSQTTFFSSSLIPKLEQLNNECLANFNGGDQDELLTDYNILKRELHRIKNEWPQVNVGNAHVSLKYTRGSHEAIKNYLQSMRSSLNELYQQHRKKKDGILLRKAESLGGHDKLLQFRDRYYNDALANYVLRKNELRQMEFSGLHYIQKQHPVFQSPLSDWGRAHFYAPEKRFAGIVVGTPWFNVIVIWLSSAVLYVTLYFDVLRKILYYFERFKLRRLNKQLQKLYS